MVNDSPMHCGANDTSLKRSLLQNGMAQKKPLLLEAAFKFNN
jgi:hypothetical protein